MLIFPQEGNKFGLLNEKENYDDNALIYNIVESSSFH